MEGKNIKVYGTLINHTQNTDDSMRDSQHDDLIAVAYQLFDERFNPKKGSGTDGAVINIDRYQDIINKRLTALTYDPDKDLTSLYCDLYVSGDTNIGGDLHVDGDSIFEGPVTFNSDVNITGDINLDMGLNDLNDVTLSTMAVGQVLRYDGSKWANAKLSLSDIQMPTASNGQVLKFNGTEWVAGDDTGGVSKLSELQDVNIPNPENNQILKFDGTKWVAGNDAGGVSKLSELQDVNVPNPEDGAKLVYDAASGKWVAQESGTSGDVDISLGDLNNVTEQNKQDSSILIYDNIGKTWKPSRFGTAPTVIYSQQTVTFTKLASRSADGYQGHAMDASDTTVDKLYPDANTVYLYSTTAAVTVPEGYSISSISPNSKFGSSEWNVVVHANDLAKSKLTNNNDSVPFNINGHTKNFSMMGYRDKYFVPTAKITSANTKTSTSSRFGTVRPLQNDGNISNYQLVTSNKNIYVMEAGDNLGSFDQVSIKFSEKPVDDTDINQNGICTRTINGKRTFYLKASSKRNSEYYDGHLTTKYAIETYSIGNDYTYSCAVTSPSRDAFLSQIYASGSTSPISIGANNIMFSFIANNNITYPETFEATIIFAKTDTSSSSIGGLSMIEGNCSFRSNGNWIYPFVPLSIDIAKNVISCMITVIPKPGAVDTSENPLEPAMTHADWDKEYKGFRSDYCLNDESVVDCTYKYIIYQPQT